jgi:UDP-GlcNAc:undecaprenyl-phosphate GlcNAc-1-phosphate transferase
VYLVYVLEILKFKSFRARELRRADPGTSEHEIDEHVARELETGEFERVAPEPSEPGSSEAAPAPSEPPPAPRPRVASSSSPGRPR